MCLMTGGFDMDNPKILAKKRAAVFSICVFGFGLLLGVIAKATDSVSIIGDIGTDLGIWVFVGTVIAVCSCSWKLAVINLPLFFVAMLISYYAYGQFVLSFFPRAYFIGWLVMAGISSIGGGILWLAKKEQWWTAIIAGLPSALLFAWAYPAFYTGNAVLMIDLLLGALLVAFIRKTWGGRLIAGATAIIGAIVFNFFDVFQLFPF